MYSVLIQNQKTIESFNEYRPLFMDALNSGEIGYCRWFESGKTIDTAVPGLKDLTEGKKEWRAIIVRVFDESSMREYKTDPENPYDFMYYIKREKEETLEEYREDTPVPLVRLTHVLGGVPAPELEFTKEMVSEEGKAPVMVFKPKHNPEKERLYRELVEQYKFDGVAPSEIILISLQASPVEDVRKEARAYWNSKQEIKSSEFWKRNKYPGGCRFVRYEYKQEGAVRKTADLFKFWNCVLMFATNTVDPSSLQGYRLYKTSVDIDKEALLYTLQEKADKLQGSRLYVDNEIKRELEKRMNKKSDAPVYRKEIDVPMEFPEHKDVTVSTAEFGLCPRTNLIEIRDWNHLKDRADTELTGIYKKADRALGESAERMRRESETDDLNILPVDKYTMQDVDEELDRLFDDILERQNALSASRSRNRQKTEEAAGKVKDKMATRVDKERALSIAVLLLMIAIVGCVPALVFAYKFSMGRFYYAFVFLGMIFLLLVITELIVLLLQRDSLVKKIDEFNDNMEGEVLTLTEDIGLFSKFVSDMVTYARGCGFKKVLRRRSVTVDDEYDKLKKHMKAINFFSDKVKKWGESFYLSINFDKEVREDYSLDVDIPPSENALYTFDSKRDFDIPMNESGLEVVSPFEFISKLRIEREELFDNAGSPD